MVESTARRERVEPQPAAAPAYLWEVEQKPVAVHLTFDLIDRLEHEVLENFRSLTSRGSEIGGLLLGTVVPGTPVAVSIEEFEAIPCDYGRGPLYRLSDPELGRFERAIERRGSASGLKVAGFFRSHTRKGLALDDEDLAFLDARFREAHHIALLVRPFATKASVAGIFIREDGRVRGDASYLEFPFRTSQLTPTTRVLQPAPPPVSAAPPSAAPTAPKPLAPSAAKPSARAQIVPIAVRREAPPSPVEPQLPAAVAPEVITARHTVVAQPAPGETPKPEPAPAPAVTVSAPPAEPAPVDVKPAPAEPVVEAKEAPAEPLIRDNKPLFGMSIESPAETTETERGSKRFLLVIGLIVVLAACVPLFVYPGFLVHSHRPPVTVQDTSPLTLRVEPTGTDLLLTWNRNADAIKHASKGVLSISDGDKHEDYPMSVSELMTGSIVYSPVSPDVSFSMEVTTTDQTKTTTESVRSLRPVRPSPMPDTAAQAHPAAAQANPTQPAAAPSAENPPAPAQSASAPEETAAPAAHTAPVKQFNTESLAQRLRSARPTDQPDANLASAAPGVAAVTRVGGSTDMPAAFGTSSTIAPPPAPTAERKAVTGGNIKPAELVYRKDPEYPALARQMGVKGEVTVQAMIGTDGRVRKVTPIKGHPLLQKAAIDAVMQWVYKPTLLNGVPVPNESKITLTFIGQN